VDKTLTFYGKRKDRKHWLRAAARSAGLHGLVLAAFHNAIPIPAPSPFAAEVDRILQQTTCTDNLYYHQTTPEEKQFIDGLVADIQDEHLDSMSFGEFMIRSEVFVHNSEQQCAEQNWDAELLLSNYFSLEKRVHPELHATSPPEIVKEIFDRLHGDLQILVDYQTYQSRPPQAAETGVYNCKSGTMWLTALAASHEKIQDNLKLYRPSDIHVLSVLEWNGDQFYYENTSSLGALITPEQKGIVRPIESIVVEYLLGRDVALDSLPKEYREWYTVAPAKNLFTPRTNSFGIEAVVGIRSETLEEQLESVPQRYPSCGDGVCAVEFDARQYDWLAIFEMARAKREALQKTVEFDRDVFLIIDALDKEGFALHNLHELGRPPTKSTYQAYLDFKDRLLQSRFNSLFDPSYTEDNLEYNLIQLEIHSFNYTPGQLLQLCTADAPGAREDFLPPPFEVSPGRLYFPPRFHYGIQYAGRHYDWLKEREGGEEVIDCYKKRYLELLDLEDPYILPILPFALDDPAFLRQYLKIAEDVDRREIWEDVLRTTYSSLDTLSLEAATILAPYLQTWTDILGPSLSPEGTKVNITFCAEYPDLDPEVQKALEPVYGLYCPYKDTFGYAFKDSDVFCPLYPLLNKQETRVEMSETYKLLYSNFCVDTHPSALFDESLGITTAD